VCLATRQSPIIVAFASTLPFPFHRFPTTTRNLTKQVLRVTGTQPTRSAMDIYIVWLETQP
jgi:hypothetical protein